MKKHRINLQVLVPAFLLAILILSYIVVIQYKNNTVLNSRLNVLGNSFQEYVKSHNVDKFEKAIAYYQFKEDAYIKQQERDTNLILATVGILFVLFGLVSYTAINERVKITEYHLKEVERSFKIIENQTHVINMDINNEFGKSLIYNAELIFKTKSNNYDFQNYVNIECLCLLRLLVGYNSEFSTNMTKIMIFNLVVKRLELLYSRLDNFFEKVENPNKIQIESFSVIISNANETQEKQIHDSTIKLLKYIKPYFHA